MELEELKNDNKIKNKAFSVLAKKEKHIFCKRTRVYSKFTDDQVKLREYGNNDVEGASIVIGFPTNSVIPVLSTMYIVELLNLQMIGDITATEHFPSISVINRGIPSHMIRIYGNKNIIFFVSEFIVGEENGKIVKSICNLILEYAHRHNSPNIVSIVGMFNEAEDEIFNTAIWEKCLERVQFCTTSPQIGRLLSKLGYSPFNHTIVSGVSGYLIAEAPLLEDYFPHITLIGASEIVSVKDGLGAACASYIIGLLFPHLEIDKNTLIKSANDFKLMFEKMIGSVSDGGGDDADSPPHGMYS